MRGMSGRRRFCFAKGLDDLAKVGYEPISLFFCVAARDRYARSQQYEPERITARIVRPVRYCETHPAP
jgi:hypothetical protein